MAKKAEVSIAIYRLGEDKEAVVVWLDSMIVKVVLSEMVVAPGADGDLYQWLSNTEITPAKFEGLLRDREKISGFLPI